MSSAWSAAAVVDTTPGSDIPPAVSTWSAGRVVDTSVQVTPRKVKTDTGWVSLTRQGL